MPATVALPAAATIRNFSSRAEEHARLGDLALEQRVHEIRALLRRDAVVGELAHVLAVRKQRVVRAEAGGDGHCMRGELREQAAARAAACRRRSRRPPGSDGAGSMPAVGPSGATDENP